VVAQQHHPGGRTAVGVRGGEGHGDGLVHPGGRGLVHPDGELAERIGVETPVIEIRDP